MSSTVSLILYKRTRLCQCDKCTVYCNGKSFERKICSYVSACELENGDQCLNVTPTSEPTTTSTAAKSTTTSKSTSPVIETPTEDLNPSMYPCWTKHAEKTVAEDYRVTQFQNGTEIPKILDGLSQFEAKRVCDILGFRI